MTKTLFAIAAATLMVPTAPALSASPNLTPTDSYSQRHDDSRSFDRRDDRRNYDRYGRYNEPRRLGRNDRIWQDEQGRYRCRRGNGTTGLIIGGAVGALAGREIDGGRNRTLGTILGAAGGALLGREIDRGGLRCR